MRAYCRRCDAAVDASGAWPGTCDACGAAIEEDPAPDVLGPAPRILLVGINPGTVTARAGLHFANPRNAFWRALHESGLTRERLEPARQHELPALGLGITNVVSRATPGSNDVTPEDITRGRERLEALVRAARPVWLAFVGKEAYRMAAGRRAPELGGQDPLWGARTFVLPSTSPANAAMRPEEKVEWFARLRKAAR